ncbi:uncharacterized protein Z520_09405 [Fonsecaea multimorphosa CBS 102226]|uniref:RNA-dependent RNA polymerase n=1 Tax=Fonsecaea multimorphosa CBS 102226 TaxID=1442371 RepID=A0A0D2GYT8_9EURO|nr:uncharacterized protein Z520_09405 [Fonsecaea multimorphosa CBS 102226]KIX94715.1 hypothetical protein Z520_09405 [Fonsecaea multimorphosa CBS 102226]OAL20490.1 hypothetical protein AYO22_08791 [Fonsecaea multimorphosa]
MELFITNLDSRFTKDKLKDSLTPILSASQIHVFEVRKAVGKTVATLTIADTSTAQSLLSRSRAYPNLLKSPSGRYAVFNVSRNPPDPHWLRVLRKEDKDRLNSKAWEKSLQLELKAQAAEKETELKITALQCGRWETWTGKTEKTAFVPYFEVSAEGRLTRDARALVIQIRISPSKRHDLVIDLSSILAFVISRGKGSSTLTITLVTAPRIYENEVPAADSGLPELLAALHLGPQTVKRFRECTLPGSDTGVVGSCLTYSMVLSTGAANLQHRIKAMTYNRFPITMLPAMFAPQPRVGLSKQVSKLNAKVAALKCSFAWRFQIHGLWANGVLSPVEVQSLLPAMSDLLARSGESTLIAVLRRLNLQLSHNDATTDREQGAMQNAINSLEQDANILLECDSSHTSQDVVSIHHVTVTPTGIYLTGPELTALNRVLRQYRAHADCFLRVLFSEEDETRIEFDRDTSNERVLQGRFLSILRNGLDIANEHFDFLGFSHSSLRSQTCWFMRPFVHDGSLLFARDLISKLGDFSAIRCPAKCAARIGQAFSETSSPVWVDPSIVKVYPDVKIGRYLFTDGCGTVSRSTWKRLRGSVRAKDQPTSYQIRYKGAKGMLTLDTRLEGDQIRLRESMVKFERSPSDEIEMCGSNIRPLPFKLNRPLIKILEDLGVPDSTFERLQEQAIQRLRLSATSRSVALNFINEHLSDGSSGLPTLLKHLQHIGVDATEDSFLREVLGALLQVQLREIKYRSRILVPEALTLYGISDETGWLKEDEVFVTFVDKKTGTHSCLDGRVAVTRSPALHPGDVQLVQAVAPPKSSPLWDLRNCIAFSQHGARDIPSMLSGGDLDGDLYNVIYDDELLPKKTVTPAAYLPAVPMDIGRPVTADDMAGFFVDFMQNDQLGRIANLHQVFADLDGTSSANCLLLAELHSTAVDFSKSGVPVDHKRIPRAPGYRPDFMAPSASTIVEKGIKRPEEAALPDGRQRYRYYESDRILGRLYRAVNEDTFFDDLEDDTSSLFSKEPTNDVLRDICDWVVSHLGHPRVQAFLTQAREVRDYYESSLLEIMSLYAVRRTERLTEKEVFIGTILGRSGAGSKHQREQSDYMKSQFNYELREIKSRMEYLTTEDGDEGFLCLAAACLHVAVCEPSNFNVQLSSFGWFAAGLCVPDIVKQEEGSIFSA